MQWKMSPIQELLTYGNRTCPRLRNNAKVVWAYTRVCLVMLHLIEGWVLFPEWTRAWERPRWACAVVGSRAPRGEPNSISTFVFEKVEAHSSLRQQKLTFRLVGSTYISAPQR